MIANGHVVCDQPCLAGPESDRWIAPVGPSLSLHCPGPHSLAVQPQPGRDSASADGGTLPSSAETENRYRGQCRHGQGPVALGLAQPEQPQAQSRARVSPSHAECHLAVTVTVTASRPTVPLKQAAGSLSSEIDSAWLGLVSRDRAGGSSSGVAARTSASLGFAGAAHSQWQRYQATVGCPPRPPLTRPTAGVEQPQARPACQADSDYC